VFHIVDDKTAGFDFPEAIVRRRRLLQIATIALSPTGFQDRLKGSTVVKAEFEQCNEKIAVEY